MWQDGQEKMINNPTGSNANANNDPLLIQEDEKVFEILNPLNKNLSKADEIAGMVAYAQYSLQKYQFIKRYQQEEGRLPTEDLLRSIIMSFKDENSVALLSLKQKAEILLKEYTVEYLENAKREEILEPIEEIIKKRTNFWSSVGSNLAAAVIYSFFVAIIVFTATAAVPNTKFAQILRILMEEKPQHNNSGVAD